MFQDKASSCNQFSCKYHGAHFSKKCCMLGSFLKVSYAMPEHRLELSGRTFVRHLEPITLQSTYHTGVCELFLHVIYELHFLCFSYQKLVMTASTSGKLFCYSVQGAKKRSSPRPSLPGARPYFCTAFSAVVNSAPRYRLRLVLRPCWAKNENLSCKRDDPTE